MNSEKVIICPGLINAKDYAECIEKHFITKISSIVLSSYPFRQENINQTWSEVAIKSKVHYSGDFFKINNSTLRKYADQIGDMYSVIHELSTPFFLSERTFPYSQFRSCATHLPELLSLVANSVALINEEKPEKIVFVLRPHNMFYWVLAKVAEQSGVEVLIVEHSPLIDSVWVVSGTQENLFKTLPTKNQKDAEITALENYNSYNKLSASDVHIADTNKNIGSSFLKRVVTILYKQKKTIRYITSVLLSEFYRNNRLNYLNNLTATFSFENFSHKKVLTFFLHYQPEATTLPAGGVYNNQLAAILKLSLLLPANWVLAVKEHPSVYGQRWNLTSNYREKSFYNFIQQLDNCILLQLDSNLDSIINASECLATITGTVGLQGVCTGKKAIVFGKAAFRNAPNVLDASGPACTDEKIVHFIEKSNVSNKASVIAYLEEVALNSYKDPNFDYGIQNTSRNHGNESAWILALMGVLHQA